MDIKKLAEKFRVSSEDMMFSIVAVCICIFIIVALIISAMIMHRGETSYPTSVHFEVGPAAVAPGESPRRERKSISMIVKRGPELLTLHHSYNIIPHCRVRIVRS